MLAHVLVLSVFAAGMTAVILLSRIGESREREQVKPDDQEPQELRAAA
jgi:hypothetical protein